MSNEKRQMRFAAGELRAAGGDGRTVTGRAITFNEWSKPIGRFRERIDPRAFDECDMSDVILRFNHNRDTILGRTKSGTLKLEVRGDGVYFECELPNTTCGNDLLELIKRGDVTECSFMFYVREQSWKEPDADDAESFYERTILKISLLEDISLVDIPAYENTDVEMRALDESYKQYAKSLEPKQEGDADAEKRARRARTVNFLTLNK